MISGFPWANRLTSLTGSILTQQHWEIPSRSMSGEWVICAARSTDSQDAESELSMQLNISGRSLREFLTGGEKKSRSHSKEAAFYFMNKYVRSCRGAAAWCEGRVQCPASIAGHSLLLLTSGLLFRTDDYGVVESPIQWSVSSTIIMLFF